MGRNIEIGDKIPSFRLMNDQGQLVEIHAKMNKPMVVYFYPKDDTPGCTIEACSFRDSYEEFAHVGVDIYGVSADSVASHAKFKQKHQLPFTLLSDIGSEVGIRLGVASKIRLFAGRVTYVVDRDGTVQHIINSRLSLKKHVKEALEVIKKWDQTPNP